jgi:Peptidase family M23/Ricin-type beta-trefoil lectin domain-like
MKCPIFKIESIIQGQMFLHLRIYMKFKSLSSALLTVGMLAMSVSAVAMVSKPANAGPCDTDIYASSNNYGRGAQWYSRCGGYRLTFQTDGNLVVYNSANRALWATGTDNSGANKFSVQADGNVVLYKDSTPLWASNTSGNAGVRLSMQGDGNLVVYRPNGQHIFNTSTDGGQSRTLSASNEWWNSITSTSMVYSNATGRALDGGGAGGGEAYLHTQRMPWNNFQRWQLKDVGNSEYMILNGQSGRPLDAGGESGGKAYLHPQVMQSNPFQRWRLQPVSGGYMIVSVATGRALDSGAAGGTQVYMHSTPMSWNPYHVWNLSKQLQPTSSSWQNPLTSRYSVTSEYGKRTYTNKYGKQVSDFHLGIDLGTGTSTPSVRPAKEGRVTFAGWDNTGLGNLIKVNHGNGVETLYAHLSAISVRKDDTVYANTTIGNVGTTGNSDGNHLHFEVHVNSSPKQPRDYVKF